MTLSPFEIERQEFGRTPMGYKRREVDGFLDEVRNTLVGLWQERGDLREEVERLTERVARFTALEEQLKNTLLLAQDSAEKACEQARRESELVMREAGQKAREIVHSAHEERQRLGQALRDLQGAEQETRQRFRALAQAVLTHLGDSEVDVAERATTLRAVVQGSTPRRQPAAGADVERRSSDAGIQGERRLGIGSPPVFDTTSFTPSRPRATAGNGERPRTPLADAPAAGAAKTSDPIASN